MLKKEIAFWYDGLGRRIRRAVNDLETPSRSYVRRFFYDGQNIVSETTDNQGSPIANFVHGPGIDEPIITARSEGVFVYTRDGLGSVREMTKANGSLTQRYRYTSFGLTTHELDESRPDKNFVENRYGFTGRELEDESGLYYYRARYYDPELGRFVSEDPIGFRSGEVNFSIYTGNRPLDRIDPSGLFWPIGIAAGVLIGGASGYLTAVAANTDPWQGAASGAFLGGMAASGAYLAVGAGTLGVSTVGQWAAGAFGSAQAGFVATLLTQQFSGKKPSVGDAIKTAGMCAFGSVAGSSMGVGYSPAAQAAIDGALSISLMPVDILLSQ